MKLSEELEEVLKKVNRLNRLNLRLDLECAINKAKDMEAHLEEAGDYY